MAHMTWENYRDQVKNDAIDGIEDFIGYRDGKFFVEPSQPVIDQNDKTIDVAEIADFFWDDDAVTGNGSGSYTFNAAKAAENIADVIWSEEFSDMAEEWGLSVADLVEKGPEAVDVAIRCYLLGEVAHEVAEAIARRHGLEVI